MGQQVGVRATPWVLVNGVDLTKSLESSIAPPAQPEQQTPETLERLRSLGYVPIAKTIGGPSTDRGMQVAHRGPQTMGKGEGCAQIARQIVRSAKNPATEAGFSAVEREELDTCPGNPEWQESWP